MNLNQRKLALMESDPELFMAIADGGERSDSVEAVAEVGMVNLGGGGTLKWKNIGSADKLPKGLEPGAKLYLHPAKSQGVPEGWRIRRMPYDTWEAGKIHVSSPDDNHCMVERRDQMALHHPMNMFYALAESLLSTIPQPDKPERECQHENTFRTGLGYVVCYQCQKKWHPDDQLPDHLKHMRGRHD